MQCNSFLPRLGTDHVVYEGAVKKERNNTHKIQYFASRAYDFNVGTVLESAVAESDGSAM